MSRESLAGTTEPGGNDDLLPHRRLPHSRGRGYFARVPALPGCTAHEETSEEAVREALVAQELWVEAATERALPLPKPSVPEGAALTG